MNHLNTGGRIKLTAKQKLALGAKVRYEVWYVERGRHAYAGRFFDAQEALLHVHFKQNPVQVRTWYSRRDKCRCVQFVTGFEDAMYEERQLLRGAARRVGVMLRRAEEFKTTLGHNSFAGVRLRRREVEGRIGAFRNAVDLLNQMARDLS